MDGAAENAHKVAQRILPDRPHHLSLSFDRRFPKPDGWWFTRASSPLQYVTYISAAQRGILTTRAAFEICDELPPPMPIKLLAKGEAKKKLSLTDYQNRKKSASPVENGVPAKTETKTNGTVHARPLPPKDDVKREESVKAVEKPNAPRQADARPEKPRPEINGERYVEQTAKSRNPSQVTDKSSRSKTSQARSQPEAESRKRTAETSGDPTPQKRAKGDAVTVKAEQPRQLKPPTPRGRDATEKASRDTKTETLHPTINGLPPPSLDRDRESTASPRSTIQVNGSRPRSDSGTSTPRKPEVMTKSALPRLLSPLHPSLFEGEGEKETQPRKKLPGKASKPEKEKAKKPLKIPSLLSPTLPPVIEEMLAQKDRKQTGSKGVSSQSSNQSSDSQGSARKTIVAAPPGRVAEEEEKPARPSRIVTFKLKKANAKRAKDLLSLPSKSAKDALKKERSASAEATPPPPAKKRPRTADDTPQEPAASKRPKTTAEAITAKPAGPTTPLKHAATTMSRVTSSQSQGQSNTPAAVTGLTPSTSDNRPPTRSEPLDPKTLAQAEACRDRHGEYQRLGSKLKHARDDLHRDRGTNMTAADERRATALHFEMVLAYMVAFDSLNQSRVLERKVCEIAAWETLLPHLAELRGRVQGNRALKALAVQMHVLCLEQITNGFASLDPGAAAAGFVRWAKHNRNRAVMWGEANAMWERVEEPRMRAVVGPWTMVDDAVAAVLAIMRRWAERDGVRWQPEVFAKAERDRERERERERDRERDRDRDRDRERERERERDRPRPSLNGSRY
ncbi:hypothetical protein C8A01DRAFT_12948 [Parachaetomium inaequale]|uniref:Uncharacterized protein n=1 Tax=Parachaetomium inaequale TaxID=2588326 RepID=A0AAN6SV00_9PEZI|nr:hypothetical protein C8A01DRAFT_12948 [Parachaetomium inaequale]